MTGFLVWERAVSETHDPHIEGHSERGFCWSSEKAKLRPGRFWGQPQADAGIGVNTKGDLITFR